MRQRCANTNTICTDNYPYTSQNNDQLGAIAMYCHVLWYTSPKKLEYPVEPRVARSKNEKSEFYHTNSEKFGKFVLSFQKKIGRRLLNVKTGATLFY